MQEGRASRTAEHNALFRALESCRLGRILPRLPGHVRFVATDFTQDDLHSRMAAAGYRESVRTHFGEAARAMRGHEFYRVALARVEHRSALPAASA